MLLPFGGDLLCEVCGLDRSWDSLPRCALPRFYLKHMVRYLDVDLCMGEGKRSGVLNGYSHWVLGTYGTRKVRHLDRRVLMTCIALARSVTLTGELHCLTTCNRCSYSYNLYVLVGSSSLIAVVLARHRFQRRGLPFCHSFEIHKYRD